MSIVFRNQKDFEIKEQASNLKFKIFRSQKGFRFSVLGENNQVLSTSKDFETLEECERVATSIAFGYPEYIEVMEEAFVSGKKQSLRRKFTLNRPDLLFDELEKRIQELTKKEKEMRKNLEHKGLIASQTARFLMSKIPKTKFTLQTGDSIEINEEFRITKDSEGKLFLESLD